MKVEITLTEEMLGTACHNKDVHEEFIASKSADANKIKEELEALPAEQLMDKAITVFPKNTDGDPMIWDYQIKGFLKEAIETLLELETKEIKVGKSKLSKWTVRRVVDRYVFVFPRKIAVSKELGALCTRPLRAQTMQGERVSLASSETLPEGTKFVCEITMLAPVLEPLIRAALDYGKLKGIGQWRNSGKGRFSWKEVK